MATLKLNNAKKTTTDLFGKGETRQGVLPKAPKKPVNLTSNESLIMQNAVRLPDPKLSKAVMDNYGITNKVKENTEYALNKAPTLYGFMSGSSVIPLKKTLDTQLGGIDTSEAEKTKRYMGGYMGGLAAQYALTGGILRAPIQQGIMGATKAGKVLSGIGADVITGAPLNITEALKNNDGTAKKFGKDVAVNTALDVGFGFGFEALGKAARFIRGKKVGEKTILKDTDLDNLTDDEFGELITKAKANHATDDEVREIAGYINKRRGKNIETEPINQYNAETMADERGLNAPRNVTSNPLNANYKTKDEYVNELLDEITAKHNPRNLATAELKKRDAFLDQELGNVANLSDNEFAKYASEHGLIKSKTTYPKIDFPKMKNQGMLPTIKRFETEEETARRLANTPSNNTPNKATEPLKLEPRSTMPKEGDNMPIRPMKALGADTKLGNSLETDIERTGELTEGIPNSTPYGDVSRHAKTIKEGEQYSTKVIKEIEGMIEDGGFGKVTKTNSVAMSNADRAMENVDDSLVKFKSVLQDNKKVTSEDLALGYKLAQHYDETGDYAKAADVLEDVTMMLSETGRTLQAARLAMKNSPLGRQKIAVRIAKKISEKTGQEVKVPDDLMQKLYSASGEKEIAETLGEVKKAIWEQVPPTWVDKFNAWRYTAMLGNPKTIVRNELGNTFSFLMREVKDVLGTGLEKTLMRNGTRTKAILTSSDRTNIKAGREFAKEYIDDIRGVGKYADINEGSRPQELPIFGQKDNAFSKTAGKVAEGWRNTTNKALNEGLDFKGFKLVKGDEGWLTTVYGNAFAKVLKANKWTLEQVKNDPKLFNKAHEIAKLEAQRATFRDASDFSNAISRASQNLRGSNSALKKGAGYAVEAAIPFKKTPVNILKRSLDYSPLGLVNGTARFVKAVKSGEDMATAIDRLAAGMTGTGVALLGAYLASQGIVKVTIPDNKEGDLQRTQGEQPYSIGIKIGGEDYTYSLDWLVPAAVPMFLGAELYNRATVRGMSNADLIDSLSDIADPVFEMSMLQGLTNLFDTNAYGDSNVASRVEQAVGNLGFSLVGQTVPTIAGQLARTVDDSGRRVNTSDAESKTMRYIDYNINKNVLSKIPFASQKTREEYVDQWGRTEENGNKAVSTVENFFSPGYINKKNISNMETELTSIYQYTGDKRVLPTTTTGFDLTYKGNKYRMTSAEQTQYKKTRGEASYSGLEQLFDSAEYKGLSEEEKAKKIDDVYDEAKKKADKEYLVKSGNMTAIDFDVSQLSDSQQGTVSTLTSSLGKEGAYKAVTLTKDCSTNTGKALALISNGNDADDVYSAFEIGNSSKNSSVQRARILNSAGVTSETFESVNKDAKSYDTSGNGQLNQKEARAYLDSTHYSMYQKYALFFALTGSADKNNPYKIGR